MNDSHSGTLFTALTISPLLFGGTLWAGDSSNNLSAYRIPPPIVRSREKETNSDPVTLSLTSAPAPAGAAVADFAKRIEEKWRESTKDRLRSYFQLDLLKTLEDDWDDNGAMKPAVGAADYARNLIDIASLRGTLSTRLYPSTTGDLGLVWERGKGFADISVAETGLVSFYVSAGGSQEYFSDRPIPLSEIPPAAWDALAQI